METLQFLVSLKTNLEKQVWDLDCQIRDISDGFEYYVHVSSYGSGMVTTYPNYHSAYQLAGKYFGDNGYANVYTTNPNPPEVHLPGGAGYHISSTKEQLETYLFFNGDKGVVNPVLIHESEEDMMRVQQDDWAEEGLDQQYIEWIAEQQLPSDTYDGGIVE